MLLSSYFTYCHHAIADAALMPYATPPLTPFSLMPLMPFHAAFADYCRFHFIDTPPFSLPRHFLARLLFHIDFSLADDDTFFSPLPPP
jgi:hypothetical protein